MVAGYKITTLGVPNYQMSLYLIQHFYKLFLNEIVSVSGGPDDGNIGAEINCLFNCL